MDKFIELNEIILKSELYNNSVLSTEEAVGPLKSRLKEILNNLLQSIDTASDTDDKIFYIKRYFDVIENFESACNTKSNRLTKIVQSLSKNSLDTNDNDNNTVKDIKDTLTPEQCSQIIKILNKEV